MPTTIVPSTIVSITDLQTAFPGLSNPGSLRSYLSSHPNVPSGTAAINLTAFRGLTAVSPIFNSVTLTNAASSHRVTLVISGNTITIDTNSTGTDSNILSVTMPNYLTNATYQGTVTFTVSSAFPTGTTFNTTTGVITVDPTMTNSGSTTIAYTRTITATNKWGNVVQLEVSMSFVPNVVNPTTDAILEARAKDLTVANGSSVSTFGTLVQTIDTTKRPVFRNVAGTPAYVEFTRSLGSYMHQAGVTLNFGTRGGATTCMLVRLRTAIMYNRILSHTGGTGNARVFEYIVNDDGLATKMLAPKYFFVDTTGVTTASSYVPLNSWLFIATRFNNSTGIASTSIAVGDNALSIVSSRSHPAIPNSTTSTFWLARQGGTGDVNDTDVRAIGYWDRCLTDTEVNNIRTYYSA